MKTTFVGGALAGSALLVLIALVQGCTRAQTIVGPTAMSEAALRAKDEATERRLTQYFEGDVRTRLNECWSRINGEGSIAARLTYTQSENRWTWDDVAITSSTLSAEHSGAALQCLRDAVRGTSFPVDRTDVDSALAPAKKFLVNWSVPVPFPAGAQAALARAVGGGPGAADSCWQCGYDKNGEDDCVAKKSGWPGCIVHDLGGCVCFGDACASGGYRGIGGVILMRASKPARQPAR